MTFNEVGLPCMALHSMIPQRQRLASLAKFKSHQVKVLIATDVASRWAGSFFYGLICFYKFISLIGPWGFDYSLKLGNFKLISAINILSIFCEIHIRWMPQHLTDH